MELDDLKTIWTQETAHLDSSQRLRDLFARHIHARRVQSGLQRERSALTGELVLVFAVVAALGSFAADHLAQRSIAVCAALLGLYGLAIAQGGIRQLVALHAIDFDEPVLTIQRNLARTRLLRLRTTALALLFGPIMWVPMCAVLLRALAGIDLFSTVSWAYIAANVLFGLAVIPLAAWIAKRYAAEIRTSRVVRGLAREITGAHLRAAVQYIDTIARFETVGYETIVAAEG